MALLFDGTDDGVIYHNASLNIGYPLHIYARFRVPAARIGSSYLLRALEVHNSGSGGWDGWGFGKSTTDLFRALAERNNNIIEPAGGSGTPPNGFSLAGDTWYSCCVSFEGSGANQTKLYLEARSNLFTYGASTWTMDGPDIQKLVLGGIRGNSSNTGLNSYYNVALCDVGVRAGSPTNAELDAYFDSKHTCLRLGGAGWYWIPKVLYNPEGGVDDSMWPSGAGGITYTTLVGAPSTISDPSGLIYPTLNIGFSAAILEAQDGVAAAVHAVSKRGKLTGVTKGLGGALWNENNLDWWWLEGSPKALVVQGQANAVNGDINVELRGSALGAGAPGWLTVSNSNGSPTQNPPAYTFSAPVNVVIE